MKLIPINKPIALTPLEAINLFKQQNPAYAAEKISYAGRLDPMAEGLLLLLVGEENKKRQEYEALPKTYEFSVLLGIETDTYDLLGKVVSKVMSLRGTKPGTVLYLAKPRLPDGQESHTNDKIMSLLQSFVGKRMQPYPPYSSRTVGGKPLYWWARNGKLDEITIPEKEVVIHELTLLQQQSLSLDDLRLTIIERVNAVNGDFRQTEILQTWKAFFTALEKPDYSSNAVRSYTPSIAHGSSRVARTIPSFHLLQCRTTCSSGTYVRSIAHEIGEKLGCGALAFSIKRTQVGEYTLSEAALQLSSRT